MKKTILPLLIFTFICTANFAQTFNENFNDGSFTDDPEWSGDTDEFIVNTAGELQLNDDETAAAYLSTPVSTADATTWEFLFRLDFSPSTSNQLKVYLNASAADLSGSLSGYFVQIGASGTDDALEFRRQNGGTSSTLLISGTAGSVGSEPALARVRVIRDATGNWQLFADYTGGTNFTLEGTVFDDTYPSGNFFGLHCKYSSTRADKFFLDDIIIDPIVVAPPEIQSITPISNTALDVYFSEPVALPSAGIPANYTVSGIGSPANAQLDAADATLVHLTGFTPPFSNGQTYTLTATGVEDFTGDASDDSEMFSFFMPEEIAPFDILINEFMAAPSSTLGGLRGVEYVELYNRSDKIIDLSDLQYSDGASPSMLPEHIIAPQEYVIITDDENVTLFTSNGITALGVNVSLSNGGDDIWLQNLFGETIHRKIYNPLEIASGISTELVNPESFCISDNWQLSTSPVGGTPGAENAVFNASADTNGPSLVCVNVINETTINILFDEILNATSVEQTDNYTVNNSIGSPSFVALDGPGDAVTLNFNTVFTEDVIYEINVNNVADCTGGNVMTSGTTQFSNSTALAGDLILNEILFDAPSGGVDFVEIYNNSDKILKIDGFQIAEIELDGDDFYGDIEARCPLLPGEYVAFSNDPQSTVMSYPLTLNPDGILPMDLPSFDNDATIILFGEMQLLGREVIDSLSYFEDFHNPLFDDTDGVSLERIDFDAPSSDPNNWQSAAEAVGFATPAYENSQYRPSGTGGGTADCVTIEDEVFSPDNDGFEDFLQINYNLDTGGYIANVRIFDARGRQIKQLINNQFLEVEGFFRWNGDTDEGLKARLGIYIVWVELFDVNGNVTRCKNTCVVAGQL